MPAFHSDLTGTRLAARVIVIDDEDRVLFFRAIEPATGHRFWLMPGGGLDPGETFEDAALRELREETGITGNLGPCVWHRRHRHLWNGRDADQFEKFFVVRVSTPGEIAGTNPDSYVDAFRWWSIDELAISAEEFAPRRVAMLLPAVLRGEFTEIPLDCNI